MSNWELLGIWSVAILVILPLALLTITALTLFIIWLIDKIKLNK